MKINREAESEGLKKKVVRIGTLNSFLQELGELGVGEKPLRYFRGHSRESFELKPSIYRNFGWISKESQMLNDLILRCPNDFIGRLTTFQGLVKMQHYGLPTRLLDITSNPLVALYFATEVFNQNDEDGEVIVFDYNVNEVKYSDSDTVSIIANLSHRASDFVVPNFSLEEVENSSQFIEKFNSDVNIKMLLHDIRDEKPHFLPQINREDLLRVVCVKPLLDNPRIIRQEGSFLLFGCSGKKQEPAALPDSAIVCRLKISRNHKRSLRNQLQSIGISQATLYPEIEQVASHIKQTYASVSINAAKLSETQQSVLRELRKVDRCTVQEISKIGGMAPSVVSRALSGLQRQGVVKLLGSGRKRQWELAYGLEILGNK